MTEPRATTEKRLLLRSMRRGIREMDLILMAWSRAHVAGLTDGDLALYDRLLDESDLEIYDWIRGRAVPPTDLAPLVARIAAALTGVVRP